MRYRIDNGDEDSSDVFYRLLGAVMSSTPTTGISDRLVKEYLLFISEGLNNKEIAERRGVSVQTVQSHLRRLLLHLEARNRTHALAKGIELELIKYDPDEGFTAT